MTKSSYETRAEKFVQEIAPYMVGARYIRDFERGYKRYCADHPRRRVHFASGMTRVAFITSNYVIKLDYYNPSWKRFGTCADEMDNYKTHVCNGYDYLFAKITRVRCKNRYYYIMPKVDHINSENELSTVLSYDEWDYICNWCYDIHGMNFGFVHGNPVIFDYAASPNQ